VDYGTGCLGREGGGVSIAKTLEKNWAGILQRVHLRSDGAAMPVQVSMKSSQDGEETLCLTTVRNISNLPTDQLTKEVRDCLSMFAVTSVSLEILDQKSV